MACSDGCHDGHDRQEGLPVPKLLVHTPWFLLNTCFPAESLEF